MEAYGSLSQVSNKTLDGEMRTIIVSANYMKACTELTEEGFRQWLRKEFKVPDTLQTMSIAQRKRPDGTVVDITFAAKVC